MDLEFDENGYRAQMKRVAFSPEQKRRLVERLVDSVALEKSDSAFNGKTDMSSAMDSHRYEFSGI